MLDWYQPCQTEYYEDGCQCSKVYTAVGMTSGNIAEKNVCVSDFFIKYSTYHRLVQHWLLKVLKPQCCAARKWRGPVHNGCMSGLGTYWTKIKQWHPTKERRRKKNAKKKRYIQENICCENYVVLWHNRLHHLTFTCTRAAYIYNRCARTACCRKQRPQQRATYRLS